MGLKLLLAAIILAVSTQHGLAQGKSLLDQYLEQVKFQEPGWTERLREIDLGQPVDSGFKDAVENRANAALEAGDERQFQQLRVFLDFVSRLANRNKPCRDDFNFGWTLWREGLGAEAKPYLEHYLSKADLPRSQKASALLFLGEIEINQRNPYQALSLAERALSIYPRWTPALLVQAEAHHLLGTVSLVKPEIKEQTKFSAQFEEPLPAEFPP